MKNISAPTNKTDLVNNRNIIKKSFSIKVIIIIVALILLGSLIFGIIKGIQKKSTKNFSWCVSGNTLKLKDTLLTVVGIEDYESYQYKDKVCHLTLITDNVISDYYLDEKALMKFAGSYDKDVGSGCLLMKIAGTVSKTELCFGNKVKSEQEEESVKDRPDKKLLEEFNKLFSSNSSTVNFAGTRWSYMIQVDGGVGGIMTFEKDKSGNLSGSFTENGPEGKKEKNFVGSLKKDNFLLTLEEFPTFKIVLSSDGTTMTGKPVEETKDVFYPDDFFKATKEN